MTRLEKLQEFLKSDPNDSFTRYCIGLEYRAVKDQAAAIATLEALRRDDPSYLPTYYMLADSYVQTGDLTNARICYGDGINRARAAGETHTMSELQAALDEIEEM